MIDALGDYVCAGDEVWRLQRGSDADCLFFQAALNGGKRITDRGTRQGTWIFAPSGELLTANHTRSVEAILSALERGRAAFEALPETERRLEDPESVRPEHRWEYSRPEGGMVLRRYGRDIDPQGLRVSPARGWNMDVAWFSAAELRASVPAEARAGDQFSMPLIARRLARLHIVDNVNGQTLPYAPEEVERAELTARIESADGDLLHLTLEGAALADADGTWRLGHVLWKPRRELPHGISSRLLGRAIFNRAVARFEMFELVALARRWGRTQNNARSRNPEPGLLAFHFELCNEATLPAPTFIDCYATDWVLHPKVATWIHSPEECGIKEK